MICVSCNEDKDTAYFRRVKYSQNKRGYTGSCITCLGKYHKEYVKNNQEKIKEYNSNYDSRFRSNSIISELDYLTIKARQNGKCAICGIIPLRRLSVDHCHKTGKIRGLLCHYCNTALGMFKDDTEIIEKALVYLRIQY